MKFISLLRYYLKGLRSSAAVLSLILTWAIFSAVVVLGRVTEKRADINALRIESPENVSILMYFSDMTDLMTGRDREYAAESEKKLEANEKIRNVFSVKTLGNVSWQDQGISIILYEPEMLSYFSGLQKNGLDFSGEPQGCVLASDRFSGIKKGDSITLTVSGQSVTFPVSGRLKSPYRHLRFSTSSTTPVISDLIAEGETILLQQTEETMAALGSAADQIEYDCNLVVVFEDHVTDAEKEEILSDLAPEYLRNSFEETLQKTEAKVEEDLKGALPMPVFLAITAFVSFFSITVLCIEKKKKDLAVLYLCGMSRKKCAWLVVSVFHLFTVFPILINILVICFIPQLELDMWDFLELASGSYRAAHPGFERFLLRLFQLYSLIEVDASGLWVVLGYYLLTMLIAITVSLYSLHRNSPLANLRGAEQ